MRMKIAKERMKHEARRLWRYFVPLVVQALVSSIIFVLVLKAANINV